MRGHNELAGEVSGGVPITDSERRTLIARAEEYEETTGGLVGFWTRVLGSA